MKISTFFKILNYDFNMNKIFLSNQQVNTIFIYLLIYSGGKSFHSNVEAKLASNFGRGSITQYRVLYWHIFYRSWRVKTNVNLVIIWIQDVKTNEKLLSILFCYIAGFIWDNVNMTKIILQLLDYKRWVLTCWRNNTFWMLDSDHSTIYEKFIVV